MRLGRRTLASPAILDEQPKLVVLKAVPPGRLGSPRPWKPWMAIDTFFMRVLAGALLISLPMVVVLGTVVFTQGAKTNTDAATLQTQVIATSAATRISDWLSERQSDLRLIARNSIDRVGQIDLTTSVSVVTASGLAFDAVAVLAPLGKIVSLAGTGDDLQALNATSWFTKSLGIEGAEPIQR